VINFIYLGERFSALLQSVNAVALTGLGKGNEHKYTIGAPNFKTLQSGNLRCFVKGYKSPNPKYENLSINKSLTCIQSFDLTLQ
jgi:hypothetical protein